MSQSPDASLPSLPSLPSQAGPAMHPLVALSIITFALMVVVGPCFGPVPEYLGMNFAVREATVYQLVVFAVAYGICLFLTFALMRASHLGLADIGWCRPSRRSAVIFAVVFGIWMGAGTAYGMTQMAPGTDITELSVFRFGVAMAATLLVPLEDIVTRGFVLTQLHRMRVPAWLQILLSALLFAAYHCAFGFNWIGFAFTMVLGLVLAGLFIWGRRSLTPVLLCHGLMLLTGEPYATMMMIMGSSGQFS
ncbi:MAG: CPBP family intramembrane metalloprotease [Gammaproteobacteria bacterium]|nr:CPBP family intramembrane metalloprotease [Gammaproteobacteria bacterium]